METRIAIILGDEEPINENCISITIVSKTGRPIFNTTLLIKDWQIKELLNEYTWRESELIKGLFTLIQK